MDYKEFRRTVRADLYRYPAAARYKRPFLKCYSLYPGFRFTFWFRLCTFALKQPGLRLLFPFNRWQYNRQRLRTGIQIALGADIGAGMYIPHFGGIVINPRCRIGRDAYISHNVTLGKANAGQKKGVPCLWDGVYLEVGSVLFGSLQVGDNAAVGANSVVLDDVAENAFVVGAPARVVNYDGAKAVLGTREVSRVDD